MTEKQEVKNYSPVSLFGDIWAIHILIAALLYPRAFLPNDKDEQKQVLYQIIILITGTLILLINMAYLVAMFTRPTWIDVAKVLFVFFTWFLLGAVFIAFNHLSDIYDLFLILEEAAIQSRDESVMLIRSGKASLEAWERKLTVAQTVDASFSSLINKLAPLALLFLRKEKNVVNIAIETFKLFFSNRHLFKKFF